jgi:GNAT superfamily N-acetyltransferase
MSETRYIWGCHNLVVADATNQIAHISRARQLFCQHADGIKALGVDINDFQAFGEELDTLPGKYSPDVRGSLWLLAVQGASEWCACVALRCHEWPAAAEVKRLYVTPAARGNGFGQLLSLHAMHHAYSLGYASVLLDSLERQAPAVRLYDRLGFKRVPQYVPNPEPDAVFMQWECNQHNVRGVQCCLQSSKEAASAARRRARLLVLAIGAALCLVQTAGIRWKQRLAQG